MSDTKNIPLEYINYLSVNDQIDNEKNNVVEKNNVHSPPKKS